MMLRSLFLSVPPCITSRTTQSHAKPSLFFYLSSIDKFALRNKSGVIRKPYTSTCTAYSLYGKVILCLCEHMGKLIWTLNDA